MAISCMPTQMPKNGLAFSSTAMAQRLVHAVDRGKTAAAVGKGANTGQHDPVGAGNGFRRIWSDRISAPIPPFAGGALEGLCGRAQIARTVIDNRNPFIDPISLSS